MIHADVLGQSEHVLLIVPSIESLSTRISGDNGGQQVVIRGSGFDPARGCGENVVHLAGVPCDVTACSSTELVCTAGEIAAQQSPLGANSGLRRRVWYRTTSDLASIPSFGEPDLVESVIDGAVGKWESDRDGYSQALTGMFVPPVTANYSFLVSGDNMASVELDTGSGFSRIAHTTTFTSGYLDQSHQRSEFVELVEGEQYPFRALQTESAGRDHLQVAVEIRDSPEASDRFQYHRVSEKQTLALTAAFRYQVIRIQLTDTTGGVLGIQDQQDVLPILLNGTNQAIAQSTVAAMRQVISGCRRFSATVTGDLAGQRALAITITYRCNARMVTDPGSGSASVQDWPTPFLVRTGLQGPGTLTPQAATTITVYPSAPVSGSFRLVQHGVPTWPINYSATSVAVTAQNIEQAVKMFPNVHDVVVTGAGNAQGSARFTLEFRTPHATPYPELTVAGLSGLTGENVTAVVDTLQDASPGTRRFDPIPVYMTKLAQSGTSATVVVRGIDAACEGITSQGGGNCTFAYSTAATPSVTSVDTSTGTGTVVNGDTITITGNNLQYNGGGVTVSFAGSDCVTQTHTSTEVTCLVTHATHGAYIPEVTVEHTGLATIAGGVSEIEYGFGVTSISPLESSFRGGSRVSLSGTGFDPTNSSANGIRIGGELCLLVEGSFESVVCIVPEWGNETLSMLSFGEIANVTEPLTISLFDGYTHAELFNYRWSLTPSLLSVDPTEISAAITTIVSMTGDFLGGGFSQSGGSDCEASMQFVSPNGDVRVCSQLSINGDNATCLLGRAPPFPAGDQPYTAPRLQLCTSDGLAVVAHPEPDFRFVDLGLRVESVSPSLGSIAGGTTLTVVGAGFSDETDTVIRSALTYNYVEAMTVINIALPDRTVPCLISSSNFSVAECTTIMPTARVAVATESPAHRYDGGGYSGLVTASVNDFDVPGCVDVDGSPSSVASRNELSDQDWVYRLGEGSWCASGGIFCFSWGPNEADSSDTVRITMNGSTSVSHVVECASH